jgi:uncharacterized protein (UPF0332 family)
MSLSDQERMDLVKYRLTEAKDTQSDVELLISHKRYRAVVNRIYYSMFYSLLALGLKYGYESSKHTQIIGWFNKTFIHAGLIEQKYGRIITKAFNRRTKGDYDSFVSFDLETVTEMYEEMKDFNEAIERFINQGESLEKSL